MGLAMTQWTVSVLLCIHVVTPSLAWVPNMPPVQRMTSISLQMASDSDPASEDELSKEFEKRADPIRVENSRDQLESDYTSRFMKSMPRKLPYNDARIWVQANLGVDTEEEFYDFVENGNLRTPYIPKQPEEYYTRTREWISWDHFLHGCFDGQNPSSVTPQSGIFD